MPARVRASSRKSTRTGSALLLSLLLMLVAGPLVWSLCAAVREAASRSAWEALANDPQTLRALMLSLWTGVASTVLSYLLCKHLLGYAFTASATRWARLLCGLPPMLAVPHAAFAIGMVALLTPGGWLLRALSPWATGLDAPPDWTTTQDPWGLGLIAVLVLKETPFLLWVAAMQLQQSDRAQRLRKELTLAYTMGYSARAAWQRVAWPQIRGQMQWPLLAVLAYGMSVVDVALLIGPTSPPTFALLTWQWLQDADTAMNTRGAAAAWLILGLIALCAAALHTGTHLQLWRKVWTQGAPDLQLAQTTKAGPTRPRQPPRLGRGWPGNDALVMLLPAVYTAVLLALAAGSVVGVWPFPALLPQSWTLAAWQSVWESREVLTTTCALAVSSAAAALLWSLVWLEWAPARWQRTLMQFIYIPLALPSVLWVMGLHRMTISWNMDATFAGLWLVHTLMAVPYVLLALEPPYRYFNPALQTVAASLGRSRTAFLLQVKWPLLKATLLAGFAVGFSVSAAQYLATAYVGAGRFATVSTEAINLAAGGQRSVAGAFAWLQWLLPAIVFALAGLLGRPRRFQ